MMHFLIHVLYFNRKLKLYMQFPSSSYSSVRNLSYKSKSNIMYQYVRICSQAHLLVYSYIKAKNNMTVHQWK